MNDEEYIKSRREIESMNNEEIRAQFGFSDDASANLFADFADITDKFFPRYINPLTKQAVASVLNDSIQNGDSPMQRRITMSIAVPIISKANSSKREENVKAEESVSADVSKLGEIRDKIRRLIEDVQ